MSFPGQTLTLEFVRPTGGDEAAGYLAQDPDIHNLLRATGRAPHATYATLAIRTPARYVEALRGPHHLKNNS